MRTSDLLGPWGEALAAEYLRRKRYQILAMNYRTRLGELDIVASNRQYIVFCEVKLRKSADFAAAREFVDAHKQQRLRQTALLYLSTHETALQPRFDVIEFYAPDGTQTRRPQITHMAAMHSFLPSAPHGFRRACRIRSILPARWTIS